MGTSLLLTADTGVRDAAVANEEALEATACGYVFAQADSRIPLFRAYNPATGGHLFTVYIDEYDDAINDGGYTGEGIACYCYAKAPLYEGSLPLYRGYNPTTDDHFYTLDPGEIYFQFGAYTFEGIACYVSPQPNDGIPLYRLREPSGLHFYTASQDEHDQLIADGFIDEGTVGTVFAHPPDLAALYEAYNPATGAHFYTMDFDERNRATNTGGMKGAGISCFIYRDGVQPAGATQLLRAYSQNQDIHFYTTDPQELATFIDTDGFTAEGVTGWILPQPQNNPPAGAVLLHRLWGDFSQNLLVPAPSYGLDSSSNYVLNNVVGPSCNAIRGLYVRIDIDEDIVCSGNSGATQGFGFQLNANSIGSPVTGWQQYVFSLQGNQLYGIVNNYIINSAYCILQYDPLVQLNDLTLPKGYRLGLFLISDDAANITGVVYQVFDVNGALLKEFVRMLAPLQATKAVGMAPIGSFQMVFVGPAGGESATLSSGAGRFTYIAVSRLRPGPAFPACVNDAVITAEDANSTYGPLPASRGTEFVQTFSVAAAPPKPKKAPRPKHHRHFGMPIWEKVRIAPPLTSARNSS
jgi:hypothetical protein